MQVPIFPHEEHLFTKQPAKAHFTQSNNACIAIPLLGEKSF